MKECRMAGRIHSIESFGTVDGPGVRLVIFFQGCPMRCKYCHNPDTWEMSGGSEWTAAEILGIFERNRTFYRRGGITATGGEPLMQLEFLTELFTEAKKQKIHTCLDTSGIVYPASPKPTDLEGRGQQDALGGYARRKAWKRKEEFDRLFSVTDLVLLDVKHSTREGHLELTSKAQEPVLAFAKALETAGVPVIVRHVCVPGITDGEEELKELGHIIGRWRNLKGVDVLAYHAMGISKYRELGIPYPLDGVPEMKPEKTKAAREMVLKGILEVRR